MISRMMPIFSKVLPLLTRRSLFMFASENEVPSYSSQTTNHRSDKYRNIGEALTFFTANEGRVKESEMKEIVKVMHILRDTARPWEQLIQFSKVISNFDVTKCDVNTLARLCGLAPLLNRNFSLHHPTYMKICQRVMKLLENPGQLSNFNIFDFLDYACDDERRQLTIALNNEIATRISSFEPQQCIKLIQIYNRRRIPQVKQWKNFAKVLQKLMSSLQTLEPRHLIGFYRNLKLMNPIVWDCEQALKKLQQTIKDKIDELDQKQIMGILALKGNLNIFHKHIFYKLMSVVNDGKADIGEDNFFKILRKIDVQDKIKAVGDSDQKLMSFLQHNLHNVNEILAVMSSGVLIRSSLVKLATSISESNYRANYQTNHNYIFLVVTKDLLQNYDYKQFINSLTNQTMKLNLAGRFMSNALIVASLHQKYPQDPKLQELYNNLKQGLTEAAKQKKFFNRIYSYNQNFLCQQFYRKFRTFVAEDYIKQCCQQGTKMNNSFLSFMISSNALNDLVKVVKANKDAITLRQFATIIRKVCANPSAFEGRHGLLSQILVLLINTDPNYKNVSVLLNYACNWEIHASLGADQSNSFLKLTSALIKTLPDSLYVLRNFFAHFCFTPSYFMKMNLKLNQLFTDIQKKLINLQDPQGLQKSTLVINELSKHNAMSKILAEKFLKQATPKTNKFLIQYSKLICGKNPDNIDGNFDYNTLILLVRNKKLKDEDVQPHLAKIYQAINGLKYWQTEDVLVNFQMIKTQLTMKILQTLLQKYSSLPKQKARRKLPFILRNFQKQNINLPAYKQLLQVIANHYSIYNKQISLFNHNLILSECISKGIDCRNYGEKILFHFQSLYSKYQITINQHSDLVENLMVVDFEQNIRNFQQLFRVSTDAEKRRLSEFFALADISEEKTQQLIIKFFKINRNIEVSEGIFQYLSRSIAELKQLKQQIKIAPGFRDNWINESLIKFLQASNIPFTVEKKNGEKLIKINDKLLAISDLPQSEISRVKLKQFYGTLFGTPAPESKNIIILFFSEHHNKKMMANMLSTQIPALKEHKNGLMSALTESKNENKRSINAKQNSVDKEDDLEEKVRGSFEQLKKNLDRQILQ